MAKRSPEVALGAIVEYEDVDAFRLAAVTGFIGKKKLIIVTDDEVERRTALASVTWRHADGISADSDLGQVSKRLRELEHTVNDHVGGIDLETIWSGADEQAQSPETLAKKVWSAPDSLQVLAMLRALRGDHLYFRERRKGWEPRPLETVERLKHEAAERTRLANERAEWVARMAELLRSDPTTLPELLADAQAASGVGDRIELLKDYAVVGDHFEEAAELERLLDLLEAELGHALPGAGSLRAFGLGVKLGIFDEHEDLGVLRFQRERDAQAASEIASSLVSREWEPQSWRRDLTDLWTCTIDDESSRDLDDAISIEPLDGGGWSLGVHIADPSEWVDVDDAIDRYARFASTSLYVPTGTVPMFPVELTERLSLAEGAPRPALSAIFTLAPSLAVEEVELAASVIRVDRRLSYDDVDAALFGASIPGVPIERLSAMRHVADDFHARRQAAGAVNIALAETKLEVDRTIEPPRATVRFFESSAARGLIGELMIATNEAIAKYCTEHNLPAIYRGQEPPDGDLYDDEIMSVPEGPAREIARLKRMRKGVVSTYPEPHAGLGVDNYVQATSPIRRYVDMVVQRQVKAHLAGDQPPYSERSLESVLSEVQRNTYEARQVEYSSNEYWMIWLLGRQREPIEATVVDIRNDTRASVFLTNYGYRAICRTKSNVEIGQNILVDVTRADPRKNLLSLREARPG